MRKSFEFSPKLTFTQRCDRSDEIFSKVKIANVENVLLPIQMKIG
jgi:hypothetical protein